MTDAIMTGEMATDYKNLALELIQAYQSPPGLNVHLGPARCVVEVGDALFAAGDFENAGYRYSAAVRFVMPALELLALLRKELDESVRENNDSIVSLMKLVEAEIRGAHFPEPDAFYFSDLREDWSEIQLILKQRSSGLTAG